MNSLPHSVGFKEWTLVCDLLGAGRQSVIIRKGGIAEGRAGFRFQHPEFLLFPTLFHEQAEKLRLPAPAAVPSPREDGPIEIRIAAKVDWTHDLTDLSLVEALAPFHFWQPAEIEKRFRYDEKEGVSVAFVRIYRLSAPFVFPDSPKYGGCRSWVNLPPLPESISLSPVLDDTAHHERERAILSVVGRPAAVA